MNWKKLVGGIGIGAVIAACASHVSAQTADPAAATTRPNILFVILDDVGIDQLKLFGFGGLLPAALPNLALIAKQGVKFTNVWAMPECSPSRAAFFTGRYPIRTGVTSAIVDNHLPQEYVSSFEATLPRVLEKAGYISSIVGKYHLGNEKDPAGSCAPATRGWNKFMGNMTAGPPSIDKTAGGVDATASQACGYFQTADAGACYTKSDDAINCRNISASNAAPDTSPSRTCLQRGGIFTPNKSCGVDRPVASDFDRNNAYYVWPRTVALGPKSPLATPGEEACAPDTVRKYMTTVQSDDGVRWWKNQTGPRMLTLSYNAIHTPYQKAPTDVVPDPADDESSCSSLQPPRRLLNNMLESIDVELGRALADLGLGTLAANGRTLKSLNLGNTVVVIVGDNGSYGSSVRAADGFTAARAKATVYQGGVWVPLIISGSVVSNPGRDVDAMINVTDLFQFFGDVAGLKVGEIVPPSHQLDSKPLMPYLQSPAAPPVRTTSFTQVAAGKFTPIASERSYPCQIGNVCNDTLLFDKNLCEDNGGTWYGPGGAKQATSCCAVAAANSSVTINPVSQFAVRNKRYKLVELEKTDCSAPLPANAQNKSFPWAEYATKITREFYDIKQTNANPIGMDKPENDFLKDCPEGSDPKSCLPETLRPNYNWLSNELKSIKTSAEGQQQCEAAGDGNSDLRVNQADVNAWKRFAGKGPSRYDINRDAQTDDKDLAIIQANLGKDCMSVCQRADLNRDGRVGKRDLTLLQKQTGKCDPVLCGGDLDGNGVVNAKDEQRMTNAIASCSSTTQAQASTR